MKHGQNNRRQRSRGNGRRYPNQRGGAFESSGPEVKVRGTAQQVLEKYQSLARDAYSAGDRILAEGYFQHAEHYYRILSLENEGQNREGGRNPSLRGNRDEDFDPDVADDDQQDAQSNGNVRRDGRDGRNGGDDRDAPQQQSRADQSDSHRAAPEKSDADSADAAASDGDAPQAASANDAPSADDQPRRRPRGRRPRTTEQPDTPADPVPAAGD